MAQSLREVIVSRLSQVDDRERLKRCLESRLPSETVLVAGGMKSGTTWMQQILHGLRSGGDMDFENIYDVVPLLEVAYLMGIDPMSNHRFQPVMAKSHVPFERCPYASRTIVITRNPDDAIQSFYHFLVDYLFTRDEMGMDEFVQAFVVEQGDDHHPMLNASQMRHLASWYPHRQDENVLWLHYEDLKADLKQCIKLISDFTGIGVGDEGLLDLVEHQASVEFMRQHKSKFNHSEFRRFSLKRFHLPRSGSDDFNVGELVRDSTDKESTSAFPAETQAVLKQKWMELLKPVTGYDSYEEMRAAVNAELGRSFP